MLQNKLDQFNGMLDTKAVKKIVPAAGMLGIGLITTAIFQYIFKSVDLGIILGACSLVIYKAGRQHLNNAEAERSNTSQIPENESPPMTQISNKERTPNSPAPFFYEV